MLTVWWALTNLKFQTAKTPEESMNRTENMQRLLELEKSFNDKET